jgi:hypothetical protein
VDTLTSTVSERLLYLPDEMLGDILCGQSIWGDLTPQRPMLIKEVEFWPWWECPVGCCAIGLNMLSLFGQPGVRPELADNRSVVQPDLVIMFDDRVLVIEAKRRDFCRMQDPKQLACEYNTACDRHPGMPVWLLAVGGLRNILQMSNCLLPPRRSRGNSQFAFRIKNPDLETSNL